MPLDRPSIIPRAIFLACSWTWCIGMFLPVYLIGDFGVWGWVAFAVPNVIGAALMGTVLRTPGASEAMIHRHTPAMRWFSIVTVLFHLYFLAAFFQPQAPVVGMGLAAIALCAGLVIAAHRPRDRWIAAPVIYAASIACVVLAKLTDPAALMWIDRTPEHTLADLAMAAPVMVFGFGLCPYLDLTFHRVRRETPGRAGPVAFWVGFVIFFTPMIALTPFYSGSFSEWIICHIFLQSAFTIGVHVRELIDIGVLERPAVVGRPSSRRYAATAAILLTLVALVVGAGLAVNHSDWQRPGYGTLRRLGYELFMSFYALVFPAYVWIVVIERGMTRATRLTTYAAALALASPCMWLGYIQQHYVWLLPGVAIPVLLPLIVARFAGSRRS
ncbi:MAG: hypothetical protein ACKVZJ_13430 [Phycisphaerales bacterium]